MHAWPAANEFLTVCLTWAAPTCVWQVLQVCARVNTRLTVKRARFSALVARELHAAMAQLGQPNERDAQVCAGALHSVADSSNHHHHHHQLYTSNRMDERM